ncbi:hypothetical protein GGI04_000073 [Coemansia thaxteri]|uniref:Transcriptional coactivator HFI1/ADA1 n=1 Tax=Coemansia thaxteri TaxID=2663907 RepID=A0A9W8BM82_9FUNG|nr:hypothetical protein H4R26_001782 [Coemansia thaxteri]KAJ2009864.1 hypothetical protein GGI04_000073 [Coemansia thaxteri]KAJ2474485.1 hypothetical protein GGI02_000012 [Coemansia sp. RSA 2322]KAJ2486074.1 hypothetical protein EV174_001349 [Coemansia sp. RSA 2320]
MPLDTAAAAKADERYQLTQLKEQLAEALGDDGPSYWSALRDFVQGKLNRQEFDFYAYLYLSGEKAGLHNQFILATIHNAQSGQAPPEGERSQGFEGRKKRKHEDEDADDAEADGDGRANRRSIRALLEDPKWRYVKELVKSLSKGERRAIKSLLKQPNITPEEAHATIRSMKPVVLPLAAAQLPQSYAMDMAKGIAAPLVFDTKSTPDIESLSYRMVALALEQGLVGGVARDAGELLLYALDCHLKNIVSNMIYKTRSNRALGIPVSCSRDDGCAGASANGEQETGTLAAASRPTTGGLRLRDRLYQSKSTLHLADLVFSLTISPSTSVEPPLCIERCGNLMANQLLADAAAEDDADEAYAAQLSGGSGGAADAATAPPSVSAALASAAGDGQDDDDHKQRRKVRRLRARYERWFGPYVTVQYGGSSGAGGAGEMHSADV